MERILTVGDCKIPLRSTAASLFSYKSNFQRDGMKDLMLLSKTMPNDRDEQAKAREKFENNEISKEEYEILKSEIFERSLADSDLNVDVFYRFLWVFAKSADKSIPPIMEWLDTIEAPPLDFLAEALQQVSELLGDTSKTSVQAKNFKAAATGR